MGERVFQTTAGTFRKRISYKNEKNRDAIKKELQAIRVTYEVVWLNRTG